MNSRLKVQVPFLKHGETVGLGDAFRQFTKAIGIPGDNCQSCDRTRLAWNALVSFTGTQPSQPPVQQPKPRPSDWRQMYGAVDDEQLPDGN